MKLFKRLAIQNQQHKFDALWEMLDEHTRKPARHISTTPSTLGSPTSRLQYNLTQMDKRWEEVREMQIGYAAYEEQMERARRPSPSNDAVPRSSNPYHNIPTERSL